MLSRRAKVGFYLVFGPIMRINGWIHSRFRSPSKSIPDLLRVHLGPGPKKYLAGWVNVDANMFTGKCDIWADLRHPLPFRDESVDAVYSYHVIEHLPDIEKHLTDVFRILKPGGVYRLGGPNGDTAIQKFVEGDHSWFDDWPDHYESIGGRMANYLLCRNEHIAILTESFLRELSLRAKYSRAVRLSAHIETEHPDLFADCIATEYERDNRYPRNLIIELTK